MIKSILDHLLLLVEFYSKSIILELSLVIEDFKRYGLIFSSSSFSLIRFLKLNKLEFLFILKKNYFFFSFLLV